MSKRTLEQRVADLERQVAVLAANRRAADGGMTGAELVAYMRAHAEALGPIFEAAIKLRERDRERAYRKFDREQARNAERKRVRTSRRTKP
jgi:hypothetical protein